MLTSFSTAWLMSGHRLLVRIWAKTIDPSGSAGFQTRSRRSLKGENWAIQRFSRFPTSKVSGSIIQADWVFIDHQKGR